MHAFFYLSFCKQTPASPYFLSRLLPLFVWFFQGGLWLSVAQQQASLDSNLLFHHCQCTVTHTHTNAQTLAHTHTQNAQTHSCTHNAQTLAHTHTHTHTQTHSHYPVLFRCFCRWTALASISTCIKTHTMATQKNGYDTLQP